MATLNEILQQIAEQLRLNGNELVAYAAEDAVGGYHIDETLRSTVFEMGSIWASEGQILYALVRALKPESIVEIGGWLGCGATHITSALRQNGSGHLTSVDNGVGGVQHGKGIPNDLRKYVTLVTANGQDWLDAQPDDTLDLVFEDADHSTPLVKLLSGLAMQKLKPGGVLVNHDAAHDIALVGGGAKIFSDVGKAVRDGLDQAGVSFRTYITEESDCGVSVAVKPGTNQTLHSEGFVPDRYSEKVDASPVERMGRGDGHFNMQVITGSIGGDTGMGESEQSPEISESEPTPTRKRSPRKAKAK